jgi:hypothetical protein
MPTGFGEVIMYAETIQLRRRRHSLVLTAVGALAVQIALMWVAREAAAWSPPSLDNLDGSALAVTEELAGRTAFSIVEMGSDEYQSNCVVVSYGGKRAASLRLFADGQEGTLAGLFLTVESGSGGATGDCTGFVPAHTVAAMPVSEFVDQASDPARGFETWRATPGEARTIRIEVRPERGASGGSVVYLAWAAVR